MKKKTKNPSINSKPFIKPTAGKPRWHTIPLEEVEDIVKVLTFGSEKYDTGNELNWQKCTNLTDYYNAMMRHIAGWKREGTDKDTGMSHLAHAAANCLFLMYLEKRGVK